MTTLGKFFSKGEEGDGHGLRHEGHVEEDYRWKVKSYNTILSEQFLQMR